MNLKEIKELMTAMNRAGIARFRMKNKEFEIELEQPTSSLMQFSLPVEKGPSGELQPHDWLHGKNARNLISPGVPLPHHAPMHGEGQQATQSTAASQSSSESTSKALFVTSPIVGTFYAAASPEDKPFISVGDTVNELSTVCIIEAMKVMNEVKAGQAGVVVERLVHDGQPVEFGTPLFKIEPFDKK